ncbi:MAG: terminase [Bacteroidales bacterium]|nr:terminase [Bacteroidales bacterium]
MSEAEIQRKVLEIIEENKRRNDLIRAVFNPVTGEGSLFMEDRVRIFIHEFGYAWYVPSEMMRIPLVKEVSRYGSIRDFVKAETEAGNMDVDLDDPDDWDDAVQEISDQICRLRSRYDFAFWAAFYVFIKPKGGGEDILFRLSRPQRRLVERLEKKRRAGKPIRLVLLKARQWGGSTCIQLYMAWLQLCHRVGLNSLIVAHQGAGSDEIQDMFDRMIKAYPLDMLHRLGDTYSEKETKWEGVGHSGSIHRVPQRLCKVKIGTAERPDSSRGGDYNLVHCSEVALWKKTDGKTPEQIVKAACSGGLLKPYAMSVYESTANGTGNFFQQEYDAAKEGKSLFEALFIAWYEIDEYALPVEGDICAFARELYVNRENANVMSDREEPGQYLWWLWERGATLEAINWYIQERAGKNSHADMASEFPSDDIEAFVHSGQMVFDKYKVEKFRKTCRPPRMVGDVYADAQEGEAGLRNIRFMEDHQGKFWIWSPPETDEYEKITDRYLVVVDIGGKSAKADWSVIAVFDRLGLLDGDVPTVVAQWYGHTDDYDLFAWEAARIACFYDNALLVIESNTLETHDKEKADPEADHGASVLRRIKGYYDNLYARKKSSDSQDDGETEIYGYHTNIKTKPEIVDTLRKVIRERLYVERDARCLDEYLTYEKKKNGAYGAVAGKHDDLLMTRGIGMHISYYEMERPRVVRRVRAGETQARRKRTVSAATI